jgi:hypothetical protein
MEVCMSGTLTCDRVCRYIASRFLALPLALVAGACTAANTNTIQTKTIYAYAPSIGAGSQPTLVPLQVPASPSQAREAKQPTNGYTFGEQQATTDAELDQLADAMVEALASAGDGWPSADAVFDKLRTTPNLNPNDGERFPSSLTKVVWSCRRPVDDDMRGLLAPFCRRPNDRYAEIYAAGFTMWRTLDGMRCSDCFQRYAGRRDQFLLGTLAAKLARAGYVDRGTSGEQGFTLGLPTPVGHVFARSSDGPVIVVSSGGIDPRTHGSAANTVVLTFFIYLPVRST